MSLGVAEDDGSSPILGPQSSSVFQSLMSLARGGDMGIGITSYGGRSFGRVTAAAGTVLNRLVPPDRNGLTRVTTVTVKPPANVDEILTFLLPLDRTLAGANAASGQGVVVLSRALGPAANPMANNDWVAMRELDNFVRLYKVSVINDGLTVTFTPNLVAGMTLGISDVWMFGVAGDTDPRTGMPHEPHVFGNTDGKEIVRGDYVAGLACTLSSDEPILAQLNNVTTQSYLEQLSYCHTQR